MNILYYYSSQQVHTGSPQVLLRLVDCLDKDKYKSFFLAKRYGELCVELEKRGVEIIETDHNSISKNNIIKNIKNVKNLMHILSEKKIELLHINELGYNFELVMAAKLLKIPTIFHIHNPEVFKKKNINCLFGNKFIFVSKSLMSECCNDKYFGNKKKVVYNPIDLNYFASGKNIKSEFGIKKEEKVIGTVAQICHRKGIDIFIDTAVKILKTRPATKFLIVGPNAIGEEAFAEKMRERVKENSLEKQILFLGARGDIPDILASLDVFFLPTRSEPFGLVLVEAIAAGVPVVASAVGGIPEVLPSEKIGITKPLEEGDFEKDIIELLDDSSRKDELVQNAYHHAHGNFSKDRFAEELNTLYAQMINR